MRLGPKTPARERWSGTPLAWDRERVAHTPKAVLRNWAEMTERMRATVRAFADVRGPLCLLDLGCGNGGFGEGLEAAVESYVGLDPSISMLREGHARHNAVYTCGVGEALPFPDSAFDVVVIKSVLMHCFDPAAVLRETMRVLRPGGLCLVSVSNRGAWYGFLRRAAHRVARVAGSVSRTDGHLFAFDGAELERYLTRAGFFVRRRDALGYLVLPWALDRWIPNSWIAHLAAAVDAIGRRRAPDVGGVLILDAVKPEKDGR